MAPSTFFPDPCSLSIDRICPSLNALLLHYCLDEKSLLLTCSKKEAWYQAMTLISSNIKYLRKKLGYTQETLAEELDIKRPSVGAYEENRAHPRLGTLSKMAALFRVSVDELINKDLVNDDHDLNQNVRVLALTVDSNDEECIELVPAKAAAGYANGYADPEYILELPKFKLPILPKTGTYRAFEIRGNSMLPVVSGSIIVGRYVEQFGEIVNGKTYVIVTRNDGVVYKRVFNHLKEKGKFLLVSDNRSHNAYEMDPSDIIEIWEAKAFISTEIPNPDATD